MERVEWEGGCLVVQGASHPFGYGMVGVYMELGLPQRAAHAAEVALSLAGGLVQYHRLAPHPPEIAQELPGERRHQESSRGASFFSFFRTSSTWPSRSSC